MTCASPPPPRAPPSAGLAPGFRFHPTDEELVGYYLKRKISGRSLRVDAIAEVDLYKEEPWDLPRKSRIRSRDAQWYFFCSLDRKYASRSRTNRATNSGYWKTTGKDRAVWRGGRAIGMKKTLVFHSGRAPRGQRTNWVMHEYRLEDEELARAGIPVDAFVVCRVFQKKGPGPQNGAQYGAPLDEEEWEDDELPAVKEEDGEGLFVVAKLPVLADELPAVKEEDGEGLFVVAKLPVLADEEKNQRIEKAPRSADASNCSWKSVERQQQPESHPIAGATKGKRRRGEESLTDLLAAEPLQGCQPFSLLGGLQGGGKDEASMQPQETTCSWTKLHEDMNKDTGIQVKSFVALIEPDKQGELSNSSNTDKLGKMREELGDDSSMDGSIGVPGPHSNQNPSPVAVNFNTTDENTSLLALDDEYVEMNDFPYIKRANFQAIIASPEETPEDFVDGGIIPSRELDDMKQYLNIDDENNISTQFLPLGTSDENCSVQLDDSQCPDPDSCSSDKPADDEFVYPDPPSHFLDAYCGFTSDINSFIDANVANTSGPAFMDELMAYFDATENIKLGDLKFQNEASTSNELKPVTVVNASLEMAANCGASSSIPDVGHNSSEIVDGHGQQGAQSDNSCDKALTERLAGILNAISPPPAFAAEYPVKHRSAAVLSSSVTAGMIQIHGIAVFGSEDLFMRKNMDAGLILSRATPSNTVTGNTAFFESVMKMPSGITTFILHNTFHLLFISVLFLAASYRIGVYVCTR